jgi:hypothetical protein
MYYNAIDVTHEAVQSTFTVKFANHSIFMYLYKTALDTRYIFFSHPPIVGFQHGMLEELFVGNFLSCLITVFSITFCCLILVSMLSPVFRSW